MHLTRWLVLFALMATACAGPSSRMGALSHPLGGGRPLLASLNDANWVPSEEDVELEDEPAGPVLGQVTRQQQDSECWRAVGYIWGILSSIREEDAEVQFTGWVQQGALTIREWSRTSPGDKPGAEVDDSAFRRRLASLMPLYLGQGSGFRHLTFHRLHESWSWNFDSPPGDRAPPDAKTLPVYAPGVTGPFGALEREARKRWLLLVQAPAFGRVRIELQVDFEDAQVTNSHLVHYEAEGRGALVGPPPGFETEMANALVPYTEGLGRRSVMLVLKARGPGEVGPRWYVNKVATIQPKLHGGERPEAFTTAAESRQLHEEIVRQWHKELADAAAMAASFSTEQLAIWIVGGWAARGAGAVLELASGPVLRILGRGGVEATEWFYCLLRRLPDAEREGLGRLWAKADTEGIKALSATERAELRAAFHHLENLAATPLKDSEKKAFRRVAQERLLKHLERFDPGLPARLISGGKRYPIHHRLTLQFAHLAPDMDINAISNLAAVHRLIHASIGRIWTAFSTSGIEVTLSTVQEVVIIVDRNYGRWYNAVFDEAIEQAQLQAAERTAMMELRVLLARLGAH